MGKKYTEGQRKDKGMKKYKIHFIPAKDCVFGVNVYRILYLKSSSVFCGHKCEEWDLASDKILYTEDEAKKELQNIKKGK